MCVSAYGTPTIEADRRTHFIARLDAAMDLFRRPARLFPRSQQQSVMARGQGVTPTRHTRTYT